MRGLPGSGKSYLVRLLAQLETRQAQTPPRVVALDDYFMEEGEGEGLVYRYDPALLEQNTRSALKAYEKLLASKLHNLIIVDAIHARRYWFAAQEHGYELYLCETERLPLADLVNRNVHGHTAATIAALLGGWESGPPHLPHLSAKDLLTSAAFDLAETREVAMEMELGGVPAPPLVPEEEPRVEEEGEGRGVKRKRDPTLPLEEPHSKRAKVEKEEQGGEGGEGGEEEHKDKEDLDLDLEPLRHQPPSRTATPSKGILRRTPPTPPPLPAPAPLSSEEPVGLAALLGYGVLEGEEDPPAPVPAPQAPPTPPPRRVRFWDEGTPEAALAPTRTPGKVSLYDLKRDTPSASPTRSPLVTALGRMIGFITRGGGGGGVFEEEEESD